VSMDEADGALKSAFSAVFGPTVKALPPVEGSLSPGRDDRASS
jgi:hypothetical protein